jgi:hypothetical protein
MLYAPAAVTVVESGWVQGRPALVRADPGAFQVINDVEKVMMDNVALVEPAAATAVNVEVQGAVFGVWRGGSQLSRHGQLLAKNYMPELATRHQRRWIETKLRDE